MEDKMSIQWYPGHMTKTRRQIEADLKQVDAVCEIVDARIPMSSRNPDIDTICGQKPRVIVLNRMDLADPAATKRWAEYFKRKGMSVVCTDCKSRKGIADFAPAVRIACKEKIQRDRARGMNRAVRLMVVGIPNVGKSTLINQISGRKGAKAENRPGVTRGKQWVTVDSTLQLLDTPGILWPKFEDMTVGLKLAFTGAINDEAIDREQVVAVFLETMAKLYPERLRERYKLIDELPEQPMELLEMVGRKRGCLVKGGAVDLDKAQRIVFTDFRSGKLGVVSLDVPEV